MLLTHKTSQRVIMGRTRLFPMASNSRSEASRFEVSTFSSFLMTCLLSSLHSFSGTGHCNSHLESERTTEVPGMSDTKRNNFLWGSVDIIVNKRAGGDFKKATECALY